MLEGKVIIITGATSGIGKAIAEACAAHGATGVIVSGRNATRGKAVVDDIEKIGRATGYKTDAVFVRAELTDPAQCRTIIDVCDKKFGRIDGLVNAAGRGTRGRLDDTSVELWDEMMNLHARAPFLLAQAAVPIMRREARPASIVNIGSVVAHGGIPDLTPYSTSKGALMTLTRNLAQSLKKDRIRVNCVNIGWTATEQEHQVQIETGQPENWLELTDPTRPLGRLLRPEDIVPIIKLLLSDRSEMITGSIIEWDQTILLGPYGE